AGVQTCALPICAGGPRLLLADGLLPSRLEFVGQLIGQALHVPDVVAILAAPLRPVGGEGGQRGGEEAPAGCGRHGGGLVVGGSAGFGGGYRGRGRTTGGGPEGRIPPGSVPRESS